MAVVIVNIICRMVENLAMIGGIVYSAVVFNKMALLWFLLLPALNVYRVEWRSCAQEDVDDGEE